MGCELPPLCAAFRQSNLTKSGTIYPKAIVSVKSTFSLCSRKASPLTNLITLILQQIIVCLLHPGLEVILVFDLTANRDLELSY